MSNQVFWLSFALVFSGTGAVASGCDTNALIKISNCVYTVLIVDVTPATTSTSTNGIAAAIRPYCSEKFVLKIKNCVQSFIEGCEILNLHVDLDRMTKAWANVCDNLDGSIDHWGCIINRFEVIFGCVEEKMRSQSAEGSLLVNASVSFEELASKRTIATRDCLTRFPDTCGNFNKIINSVGKVIFPPLCDKSSSRSMSILPSVLSACVLMSLGPMIFGKSY